MMRGGVLRSRRCVAPILMAALLGLSPMLLGRTLSVDDDPLAEFQTIQAAIDAAVPGDIVSVAAGTYQENILLKSGVKVVGAGAGASIIDGRRQDSVAVLQDCDSETWLQGFTLTNGEAEIGGGILVLGGSPIITLNHITGNSAVTHDLYVYSAGGGVALYYSYASAYDNDIDGNDAEFGGGVEIVGGEPLLSHNHISGNTAQQGGGVDVYLVSIKSPRVHANIITLNSATFGAGVEAAGLGTPLISNNLIAGNVAAAPGTVNTYGGGVDIFYSNARVINNTVAANEAEFGGGISVLASTEAPQIINSIIFGNTATLDSGGLDLIGGNILIQSAIIFQNVDTACGGPSNDPCLHDCGGDAAFKCMEDLSNLFEDPRLVDPAGGDFRLLEGSPAIDSAQIGEAPDDDLRGQRRPLDGNGDWVAAPDRGAYEFDGDDVLGLRFLSADTLTWNAARGASAYHLYSGALAASAESGVDTCRDSDDGDRTDLLFTEPVAPDAGQGFAYLVTAVVNAVERSPGFDSQGLERSLPLPCP